MRPTRERILALLAHPQSVSELAAKLKISNQAIRWHLKDLVAENRVRALRRQRGLCRVWYERVSTTSASKNGPVPNRFDGASDRLLRRLIAESIYGMDQIVEILGSTPPHATLAVNRLIVDGHLWTFKVAGRRLCLLTKGGVNYATQIGCLKGVAAKPIASLISERRAEVLLALANEPHRALKALKATSIILQNSSDIQLSKVVKSLRDDGLVVTQTATYPGLHSLTPLGALLAAHIEEQG